MRFLNWSRTIIASALLAGALGSLAYSQGFLGPFRDGIPSGPSIFGTTDSTAGLYFGTNRVGVSGHLESGVKGPAVPPVLSTCGTSPSLATGSTDTAGKITVGTSASNACTLTFGTAYTSAPFCIVQNATTGAGANVYTVIAATIVWSSALADSTVLFYHCFAASGG